MTHPHTVSPHTVPPPIRDRLRAMIAADGEPAVRRRLRIGRPTLARALAGLGVRLGTVAQIRAALDALDAEAARAREDGAR